MWSDFCANYCEMLVIYFITVSLSNGCLCWLQHTFHSREMMYHNRALISDAVYNCVYNIKYNNIENDINFAVWDVGPVVM